MGLVGFRFFEGYRLRGLCGFFLLRISFEVLLRSQGHGTFAGMGFCAFVSRLKRFSANLAQPGSFHVRVGTGVLLPIRMRETLSRPYCRTALYTRRFLCRQPDIRVMYGRTCPSES